MSVNKKKYNDHIQERGSYAVIPNEIWEIEDVDHIAKIIFCYIVSRSASWSSSRNNIANNLNISRNTVTKYLDQLADFNLINVKKGTRNSWDFEINPPCDWVIPCTGSKLDRFNFDPVNNATGSSRDPVKGTDRVKIDPVEGTTGSSRDPHPRRTITKLSCFDFPEEEEICESTCELPEEDNNFSLPEIGKKTAPPTFEQIVNSWKAQTENPLSELSGKSMKETLGMIVSTAYEHNVSSDEVSENAFIRLVFKKVKNNKKVQSWIDDIKATFCELRDSTYSNINFSSPQTCLTKPPGKIKNEDEEFDQFEYFLSKVK